jgi:hypothetical protein
MTPVARHSWALSLACLLVTSQAVAQVDFDVPRSVSLRPNAASLLLVDLNSDKNVDVLVTMDDTSQPALAVLYGDGTGGFDERRHLALPAAGRHAVSGDFNGDRLPDVAVAVFLGGLVVLLNDGRGSLGPPITLANSFGCFHVVTGDLTRDGHLDLLASLGGSNELVTYRGDGRGGFVESRRNARADQPGATVLADFDEDGRLDAAACETLADRVAVLRGDGAGGFSPLVDLPGPDEPTGVLAPDLNRDGHRDLVVVGRLGRTISFWLGDGRGGFSPRTDLPNGVLGGGVVAADFDRDGNIDLASTRDVLSVSLFRGNGAGGFEPRRDFGGPGGNAIAAADVDRDGALDLVTLESSPVSRLWVFRGDGAGQFRKRSGLALPSTLTPRRPVAADLDGDGDLDGLFLDRESGDLMALLGDGTGALTTGPVTDAAGVDYHLGNVDGDGLPDAVVLEGVDCSTPAEATVFLNDGSGGFVRQGSVTVGTCAYALLPGDFIEDGHLDLAVVHSGLGGTMG